MSYASRGVFKYSSALGDELGGVATSDQIRSRATPDEGGILSIARYLKDTERPGFLKRNSLVRDQTGALRVEWR